MSRQFGVANLTVSGIAIARLHNVNVTISYDSAPLRGDNRIFPDAVALYNGNIEGSYEVGDVNLTAVASHLGADVSFAGGSGTMTLTATQVLATGADIEVSAITDGVTGTLTFKNCLFNSFTLALDRENWLLPATNFIVKGDSNGVMATWQI